MSGSPNPPLRDRDVEFVLYELLHAPRPTQLPLYPDHSRETFDLFLQSARRLARDVLFPSFRPMDEQPARFHDGAIETHPRMKVIYPLLVELGIISATRPYDVGGQQLPFVVATAASAYLMAGNAGAFGYAGL